MRTVRRCPKCDEPLIQDFKKCPICGTVIKRGGKFKYKPRLKVSAQKRGETKTVNLSPNNPQLIGLTPEFKRGMFEQLHSQTSATIEYRVVKSLGHVDRTISKENEPVKLLSYRDMIWGFEDFSYNLSPLICAWITSHSQKIEDLLRISAEYKKKLCEDSDALYDYQKGEYDVIMQLYAIFEALKYHYNIEYIGTPPSFALSKTQRMGNCTETTVTKASAAEALGLVSAVIFPPRHAFLGVSLNPKESMNSLIGMGTTFIPNKPFVVAIDAGSKLLSALCEKCSEKELAVKIIFVPTWREYGVEPME